MDVTQVWRRKSYEVGFSSAWFEVRRDQVLRPDGSAAVYDHVVVPASVTVLAVDAARRVAVTRQWIYPHGATFWRLPAGRVDLGESPRSAARRELAEETGVFAADWAELGSVCGADSLTNHRDHTFLATELTLGAPSLEPGETDLLLYWLDFADVLGMVLGGRLPHAGSAFALLAAHARKLVE